MTGNLPAPIPVKNLWHMLLYAWDLAALRHQWSVEIENAPNLDTLLATILLDLLHKRFRIGLGRSYRKNEDTQRRIRGKIDFSESLRRLAFENGQAHCSFHEYSINVPKNQIIRSSLAKLARIGQFGTNKIIRTQVLLTTRLLDGIDEIPITPELIRRQPLGRNDLDYRLILAICELIALDGMPTETEGTVPLPCLDKEEMTLHRIFEKFVANFYRLHLDDWSIKSQVPLFWPSEAESPYLPSMVADLQLQHRENKRMITLDTKFYRQCLVSNSYGKTVFHSSHLYQIYAYLKSQEHKSEHHRNATGILLYPMVSEHLSETIDIQGHQIHFKTVDLSKHWHQVETQLLELIA